MRIKQAEYISVMKCPECGKLENLEPSDMPKPDDFQLDNDDNIICPCGCVFKE